MTAQKQSGRNLELFLGAKDKLLGGRIIDVSAQWNDKRSFGNPMLSIETTDGEVLSLVACGDEELISPGFLLVSEANKSH